MSSSTTEQETAGQDGFVVGAAPGEKLERRLEELLHQDRFVAAREVRRRRTRQRRVAARTRRAGPGCVLGRAGADTALGRAVHDRARRLEPAVLQVVYRRQAERLVQLPGPARRGRPRAIGSHSIGPARRASERAITYAELHRDVQRLANALKDLGVGKGDVVGIYLPMIPEVVVAMLACARIGAPHNVVFGGFAPEAVRERMDVSRRQGADHRRRRAAQGQDRAGQGRRSTQ